MKLALNREESSSEEWLNFTNSIFLRVQTVFNESINLSDIALLTRILQNTL